MPLRAGSEVLRDGSRQGCLGNGANNGVDLLTALENHQGGNTANAVLARDVGVFVGIQLEDFDLTVELLGDLLNDWSNHATGATPGSPEINQYRNVALEDVLLERGVGDRSGARHMSEKI